MATGTIQSDYAYDNPTLTTPSSVGLNSNASFVHRKGNLCILYVNVRKNSGFTSEQWTTIHTLNVHPSEYIQISTVFNGQTATVDLDTDGNVRVYAHGSAFTYFVRVVIPFFV